MRWVVLPFAPLVWVAHGIDVLKNMIVVFGRPDIFNSTWTVLVQLPGAMQFDRRAGRDGPDGGFSIRVVVKYGPSVLELPQCIGDHAMPYIDTECPYKVNLAEFRDERRPSCHGIQIHQTDKKTLGSSHQKLRGYGLLIDQCAARFGLAQLPSCRRSCHCHCQMPKSSFLGCL